MNRTQHHEKAEQLLSDAHGERDSIRRSQILAEAQVHATLALSAPAGERPPGREQPETRSTASAGEASPASAPVPRKKGPIVARPDRQRRPTQTPAGADQPVSQPAVLPGGGVVTAAPAPAGQAQPTPRPQSVPPWTRRRTKPGDPGDEEPGKPGAPKPGDFRPFSSML
jgi:hypothetical protein